MKIKDHRRLLRRLRHLATAWQRCRQLGHMIVYTFSDPSEVCATCLLQRSRPKQNQVSHSEAAVIGVSAIFSKGRRGQRFIDALIYGAPRNEGFSGFSAPPTHQIKLMYEQISGLPKNFDLAMSKRIRLKIMRVPHALPAAVLWQREYPAHAYTIDPHLRGEVIP